MPAEAAQLLRSHDAREDEQSETNGAGLGARPHRRKVFGGRVGPKASLDRGRLGWRS